MSVFQKQSALLDQGYKVTDVSCSGCKYILMIHLQKQKMKCPKCDLELNEIPEVRREEVQQQNHNTSQQTKNQEEQEQEIEEELRQMFQKSKVTSQDNSKLLSVYLTKGYCMMRECCSTCLIPYMKKKNIIECVGCNKKFTEETLKQLLLQEEQNGQFEKQTTQQKSLTNQPKKLQQSQLFEETPEDIQFENKKTQNIQKNNPQNEQKSDRQLEQQIEKSYLSIINNLVYSSNLLNQNLQNQKNEQTNFMELSSQVQQAQNVQINLATSINQIYGFIRNLKK